ncbi:MAG: enoyl-CoA hydratase/isomerase family protein [Betaproteobacteria bacterium]|nr:enoyl-CoA hydratase/isomerase family protein [Betaproteobacteria bacterium]
MTTSNLFQSVDARGVATLTMNRPEVHNAFDDHLIAAMTTQLRALESDPRVRMVILAAAGKSFSAGADLNWMKRMAAYSEGENLRDARALAELMRTLNGLAKPTIARLQGSAFAGGMGLVACCDIAVAVPAAVFSLTEVRLGLTPAVISPYVVRAIGQRMARRYFLTAERFSAHEALRMGLVHAVVPDEELDKTVEGFVSDLLKGGPECLAVTKDLVATVAREKLDSALVEHTASRIAKLRVSAEGQEGIASFLEKRAPKWTPHS